jgi:hypothetical protein
LKVVCELATGGSEGTEGDEGNESGGGEAGEVGEEGEGGLRVAKGCEILEEAAWAKERLAAFLSQPVGGGRREEKGKTQGEEGKATNEICIVDPSIIIPGCHRNRSCFSK